MVGLLLKISRRRVLSHLLTSHLQDDDDNPGENNEENLGSIDTTDLMHDVTGDVVYPAICECDGMPIDPTVAGYLP